MGLSGSMPPTLMMICILALGFGASSSVGQSQQEWLQPHNRARAAVGVGPLVWDENVAAYARNYANQHYWDCQLQHSSGPYGENLAWGSGDLSPAAAIKMWVDEKAIYDYNSNSCTGDNPWGCLHYTQVVWRNTRRIGCAKVRCNSGGTFITCNYDPPGNYNGQWPYSVLATSI